MIRIIKRHLVLIAIIIISIFSISFSFESSAESDEDDLLDSPIEFSHLYPTKITFYKGEAGQGSFENVNYHIEADNFIIKVPYSVTESNLRNANIAVYIPDGKCEFIDEAGNPLNKVNLLKDSKLVISMNDGRSEVYNLSYEYITGDIDVIYIYTNNHEGVNSREEYVSANLILDGEEYLIDIRGRGNVSWWGYEQHGYMLKFDKNVSLLGFLPAKKYSIISTYGDPSLIRNAVAMKMASCLDNMEYTPKQKPIDLFLDGEYVGIYTLSEKIDVSMDKINLFSDYDYMSYKALSDNGLAVASENEIKDDKYNDLSFLIELGGYSKGSYSSGPEHFSTYHIRDAYIKYPETEDLTLEQAKLIKEYLTNVDGIITRRANYQDYIDIDDWVDWFIIMEYSNSTDSAFQRSTYLYKRPGGKLYLGPVWDFDKAFGNYGMDNPRYDTWCCSESDYAAFQFSPIHYLYQSDDFMYRVQARWDEKKDELKSVGKDAIDDFSDDIAYSRYYNNRVSGKNGSGQVGRIKTFLDTRYNWIDKSIHAYNFNRNPDRPSIKWNESQEEKAKQQDINVEAVKPEELAPAVPVENQ